MSANIVLTESEYPNGRAFWRVWVSGNVVSAFDSGAFGGFVVRGCRKAWPTREAAAREGVRRELQRKRRDAKILSAALESGQFLDAVDPDGGTGTDGPRA